MHFADQSGVLVLIRLLLGLVEYGHPHWFGIQPDFKQWCVSLCIFYVLITVNSTGDVRFPCRPASSSFL